MLLIEKNVQIREPNALENSLQYFCVKKERVYIHFGWLPISPMSKDELWALLLGKS